VLGRHAADLVNDVDGVEFVAWFFAGEKHNMS